MKKSEFVLQEHYIEYPEETTKHWDIRVKAGKHLEEWNIYQDPLMMEKGGLTQVAKKVCRDPNWMKYDRQWVKVGGIPTYVDILDKGDVEIDQKSPTTVIFKFLGERLKGRWQLMRRGSAWLFVKLS